MKICKAVKKSASTSRSKLCRWARKKIGKLSATGMSPINRYGTLIRKKKLGKWFLGECYYRSDDKAEPACHICLNFIDLWWLPFDKQWKAKDFWKTFRRQKDITTQCLHRSLRSYPFTSPFVPSGKLLLAQFEVALSRLLFENRQYRSILKVYCKGRLTIIIHNYTEVPKELGLRVHTMHETIHSAKITHTPLLQSIWIFRRYLVLKVCDSSDSLLLLTNFRVTTRLFSKKSGQSSTSFPQYDDAHWRSRRAPLCVHAILWHKFCTVASINSANHRWNNISFIKTD